MQRRIPLLLPDMPSAEELLPWLRRIDAARWYTNFGPLTGELERALGERFGDAVGVVSVNNCTVGLELALQSILKPSSRALMPALTFVATAASALRWGHTPVLADVDEHSWLLTPQIARRVAAAQSIDVVMPVSTYGCPHDASAWDAFVAETGIPVILDAAGGFDNQAVGRHFAAVFSLHATKSLGAGEGGFVVATDRQLLSSIRGLSNFGIDLLGMVPTAGTNGKLSEYHAAVALASLERWPARKQVRIALHGRYLDTMRRVCPEVRLQSRPPLGAYSILPVLLPARTTAEQVRSRLGARGIETRRWYCPTIEKHPAFREVPRAGPLQIATQLSDRLLALPFHPFLSDEDVRVVCGQLAAVLDG
jgi:dTDP-4-amino-4,6-dideoxygalactose transaminase